MTRVNIAVLLLLIIPSQSAAAGAATAFTALPSSSSTRSRPFRHELRLSEVPAEDPGLTDDAVSLSGIPYASVLQGLDILYPPTDLSSRNAVSRTDGYWPFVKDGNEPPQDLTYGEWDLPFFAQLVDRSYSHFKAGFRGNTVGEDWTGATFVDIGSGGGRLVLAAAALHRWRLCRGVEILPGLHAMAEANVAKCQNSPGISMGGDFAGALPGSGLPLCPTELTCGSIDDPATTFIGDVDCAFVASSCMSPEVMQMIATAVGTQCRAGTVITTTDYELPLEGSVGGRPWRMEQLDTVDGYCWVVGGLSTAYIYRVVQSLA